MPNDCESFNELPSAEATFLWVIRVWVIGHLRQQDVSAHIGTALREIGADRSQPFLDGFMGALSRGARRPLEILCLCRTEVTADERLLLDSVALIQQDETVEALDQLCTLLTDPAAAAALRSAEGIADDFVRAGILLPWDVAIAARQVQPRVLH